MKMRNSFIYQLALLCLCARNLARAQFLFTYEINNEDDSRTPKNSLFDPSAFKIVTPSQLQSAYQKMSHIDPSSTPSVFTQDQREPASSPPTPSVGSQSLLKQTSAAIQSLAELFNLTPGHPPDAPQSPLVSPSMVAGAPPDRLAEVRSLHEHWTQQQQKSHQQNLGSLAGQQPDLSSPALNSFTTTSTGGQQIQNLNTHPAQSSQQQQQQQQQSPPPQQQTPQQQTQASYWLTANPLNSPDGNFLVQIKPQHQQAQHQPDPQRQQQPAMPDPNAVVDNLLAIGHRTAHQAAPAARPPAHSAQASFMSTPASLFPPPAEGPTRQQFAHDSGAHHAAPQFDPQAQRAAARVTPAQASQVAMARQQVTELALQPPANIPDNFMLKPAMAPTSPTGVNHKSAEEALISFRLQQAQMSRHQDQQAHGMFPNQRFRHPSEAISGPPEVTVQPTVSEHNRPMSEVPKVSPQIYESFLLQQRDQHEKHMELLKQQQELNKLLEQKRKQQEAELKRKQRKKEELDREARKKALREQELARKLKIEMEERELARKHEEEMRKREEELRYREQLEREQAIKRQRQMEEERELRRQRELAELRRAEAAEKERREKADAAEKERRERAKAEAEAIANYLRQQEELKKLLEMKAREEEAQQRRHKLTQEATSTSSLPTRHRVGGPTGRPHRLTGELRSSSWGAPIRSRTVSHPPPSEHSILMTSTSPTSAPTTTSTTSSSVTVSQAHRHSSETAAGYRARVKKLRNFGNERLIKQKIPLYSGPGQYGLYRGAEGNSSLASDLAALLDSVVLPTSSTTAAPTSTSTQVSTYTEPTSSWRRPESSSSSMDSVTPSQPISSSLSPLLTGASGAAALGEHRLTGRLNEANEPMFDDDVPRRPARGLVSSKRANLLLPITASSDRHQTSLNESSIEVPSRGKSGNSSRGASIGLASLPVDSDNDGIPGRAGIEYPVLSAVPSTSFSCAKQPLNGYYADTETACQVVHLCQSGVQSSILCPNGTIFNQEKFSCQWWYEVNCSRAPMFYQLNDNLYKYDKEEQDKMRSSGKRASLPSKGDELGPRGNLLAA